MGSGGQGARGGPRTRSRAGHGRVLPGAADPGTGGRATAVVAQGNHDQDGLRLDQATGTIALRRPEEWTEDLFAYLRKGEGDLAGYSEPGADGVAGS